jgi:hypothetical protein
MMIIYSPVSTPRLRYAGDILGYELLGQPPLYTNDPEELNNYAGARINYSDQPLGETYWIRPAGLMGETGIRKQEVTVSEWKGNKILFPVASDHPLDIFSSLFYLLSRYEEWLPHQVDEYGRYAHLNSIAWRENFLHEPLVDKWLADLGEILQAKFKDFSAKRKEFRFLPTYDIDEAWSFRNKSVMISLAGTIKDIFRGRMNRVRERQKVRAGKIGDPFDSYDWMDSIHNDYNLSPLYFFLVAGKRSRYDRNIDPSQPEFIELVKRHASKYKIGIHPSWQSGDAQTLVSERSRLHSISAQEISSSRQHFIRFRLPDTFRQLIDAGIRDEYSMGYGSVNGFRASASFSFYWYDLEKEQQTSLKLHPFCFMDANCFFEQRQTPLDAEQEMRAYYDRVKAVNGTFISIWHNTFLGTDPLFRGWREAYLNFLKGTRQH